MCCHSKAVSYFDALQDWIDETKATHCNWKFEWPVSKSLEDAGFYDSYRKVHPSPLSDPGITWSPIYKTKYNGDHGNTIPEPQDRIDFIMYKSSMLIPVNAFVYTGQEPVIPFPFSKNNDWKFTHSSVVVDFEVI